MLIKKINQTLLLSKCKLKNDLNLNKKGVSNTIEIAGFIALVVAAIMIVTPFGRDMVGNIWNSVTSNANSYFNSISR